MLSLEGKIVCSIFLTVALNPSSAPGRNKVRLLVLAVHI